MKKLELTKTEQRVIDLIGYETRESKTYWNPETKKTDIPNPEYYKKNRQAIRRAIRENEVETLQELFSKLNNEKKAREAEAEERRKEENREDSARKRVNRIIYDYAKKHPVSFPTKKLASELISFDEFKKATGFARKYFLKNFLSESLEYHWPLATGAHENFWGVTTGEKIMLVTHVENDWGVYSNRTKYPAHHYTFRLYIPANYSFTKIGGLITIFKGQKIDRSGMEVTWLEQSRGMEVKEVEGFLVRGFHLKKSKTVLTLEDAVEKAARLRSNNARQIRERRFWKSLSREEITERLKTVWITVKDSVSAGNCPAGTQAFKNRYERKNHFGDIGAVRGDELINQANGEIHFIKKIFAHKFGVQL
jgi:hypothetical protein